MTETNFFMVEKNTFDELIVTQKEIFNLMEEEVQKS